MRFSFIIILILTQIISGCKSDQEKFLFERKENWGEWHAGDTTSIQYDLKAYKKGRDTIYQTTNYYPNGVEKCKTVFVNDRLEKIFFVNDTNGNPLDFGKLENGTGQVRMYDFKGILEYSGNYVGGNKEGWWYFYHYSGEILDSTLYEKGYNISSTDTIWIDKIFGHIGQYKNNLYD